MSLRSKIEVDRSNSKTKVVEETWDDDFVFEVKPKTKGIANVDDDMGSLDGWKSETPVPILPERHKPIYYDEDPDIIPNVGFADFFEEQFSSSLNSVDGNPPSEYSHSPFYAESATDTGDEAGSTTGSVRPLLTTHYPLTSVKEFDGSSSNHSMTMFDGSQAGDRASSIKMVSFDEGDRGSSASDSNNNEDEENDDEDEEEDDWDAELVNEQRNNQDPDHTPMGLGTSAIYPGGDGFNLTNPLDNPFNQVNTPLPIGTNEHRKENLLEYLEGVIQGSLMGDNGGGSGPASARMGVYASAEEGSSSGGPSCSGVPGKMSASSTLRAYFCAEETRALESANQHLKGLFSWIETSTASLKSVLHEKNCSDDINARLLLESEIHQLQRDDVYFVERLLTKCEENPSSESCVYSLEVIIKWIRAVCCIYDEVQKKQQASEAMIPPEVTASAMLGEANKSFKAGPVRTASVTTMPFNNNSNTVPSSSSGVSPASRSSSTRNSPTNPGTAGTDDDFDPRAVREDLLRNISYEKIEAVFERCDYILVEQSRSVTGRILECFTVLDLEFNSSGEVPNVVYHDGFAADVSATSARAAVRGTVSRMMQLLSNQINVFRVQTHMLDIKTHVTNSNHRRVSQGFDLFASLKNLQTLIDQLDTVLNSWLRMLYYFLPAGSVAGGEGKEGENYSLASQCFDNASDPRIVLLRNRLALGSSTAGHQYSQHHVEVLLKIVVDLQALCVANKLFVISAVSPISLQERDIYTVAPTPVEDSNLSGASTPPLSATTSSTPVAGSPPAKPKRSHYFPNLMRRKEDKLLALEMQKAKRNSFVKKLPLYDISYEAAIGSQFISLMMLIPSPSIARSKLSFAAYCYLNRMRNDELPWQQVGRFRILDPEYSKANGLNYSSHSGSNSARSRGYSTPGTSGSSSGKDEVKTLSIDVVESGILDSFSEAFGSLDEARILQLLLYEAAVDLYPNSTPGSGKMRSAPSPMRSTANKRHTFRRDVFHFSNKDTGTGMDSDYIGESSLRHLFYHVPFSMNLSHSILECLKDPHRQHSFSSGSARHGGLNREISGSSYTSSRVTSMHSKHSSWGGTVGTAVAGLSYSTSSDIFDMQAPSISLKSSGGAENSFIAKFVPSRAKNKIISYSLRFELFNLSYEIFSHLSKCVIDTCPSAALGLYNMCAILLAHMHKKQERLEYHRDAAVLAVKLEKHEEAIMHGKYVLNNLLNKTGQASLVGEVLNGFNTNKESPQSTTSTYVSSSEASSMGSPSPVSSTKSGIAIIASDQDINELMYVTELMASEYCENAQPELAIKTIFATLNYVNNCTPLNNPTPRSPVRSRSNSGVSSTNGANADSQSQFDRVVYPLMLRLGSIFYDMGCSMKAADTYQLLLLMLTERMDCVANDEKKVAVLSWIAECYLEMDDIDTATKMLKMIKEVRKVKIDKYTTPIPLPATLSSANTNTSGIALDSTVKNKDAVKQTHPLPQTHSPHSVGDDSAEPVGPTHQDREFLAMNRLSPSRSMSLYNQRKLFPFSRTPSQRSSGESHPPSSPPAQPRITSKKLFFADSPGMKLRYHLNCKESNLPKNCITTYNTDLGDLTSRIYFRNKQFIPALKSLTPTIIGVELMVGGKTAATAKKDALLELGKLYYLRGKIQLEASKATNVIKFPFEVGSVQLFSAIQLISSDVKKAKTGATQVKKQFSRGGGTSGAPATAPSLQSTESFMSSSGGGPGISRSDSMHTSGESSGSGKPTFYSGTNNLLSCKRTITYANPSDLLWDAMKWFRRAWDLFHAAGDEVSAAKSANYIAKCHLTPCFVPTVYFDIPLEKSCNLSSLVLEAPNDPEPLSASTTTIIVPHQASGGVTPPPPPQDTPRSNSMLSVGSEVISTSPQSPKNASRNGSGQFALDKQLKPLGHRRKRPEPLVISTDPNVTEGGSTSELTPAMMRASSLSTKSLSSVLFANLRTDSVDDQSFAPLSVRSHSTSSGLLQVDTAAVNASSKKVDSVAGVNGSEGEPSRTPPSPRSVKTNILLRRASLEEVQRVMQFALDTSIECCLPLLMIETYTNLAELYTLQGNKGDGTAYWIEAKELFVHLFVDGTLLPIIRRASLQYVTKLFRVYSRLIRFMWTCERSVINRNLSMLDLQLLFTSEIDRITKKMTCMSHVAGKSLDLVVKQLSSSLTPSQPAAAPERRTLSSRFRTSSLRMMGISNLSINIDVPPPQVLLTPVALEQYFKRHHSKEAMTDKEFYQALNKDMTDRKLYDFGWRQYLDYESMLKEALMVNHRASVGTEVTGVTVTSASEKLSNNNARERSRSLGNTPAKRKSLVRKLSSFLGASSPDKKKTVSKHKSMQSMMLSKNSNTNSSASNISIVNPNNASTTSLRDVETHLVRNILLSLYRNHRKFDTVPRGLQKFILLKEDITAEGMLLSEEGPAATVGGAGGAGGVEEFSLTPRSLDNTLRSVDTVSTGSTMQGAPDKPPSAPGTPAADEKPASAKKGLRRKSLTPKNHSILNNSSSDSQDSSSSHSTTTDNFTSSNSTLNLMQGTKPTTPAAANRGSAVFISKSALFKGNRYRPLDAHSDFEWMDESYSNYYTETLIDAGPQIESSGASGGDLSIDEDFLECCEGCGVDLNGGDVTLDYIAEVEAHSESVLIQRVWRCLLVIKNAERNYQNRKHSMEVLRNTVRNALRNLSLFMLRLRAFSKQYKGRITSYDELLVKLNHEHDSTTEPQLTDMRYIGKSDSSDISQTSSGSGNDDLPARAVGLTHRLPHLVYTLHINNLLMLYRPHDGTRHIQLFGGNGFLVYSTVEKPSKRLSGRRSDRLSGSHLHGGSHRVASSDSRHHAPMLSSASFMLPFVSYSGDVDDNPHQGDRGGVGMVPDALKMRGMQRLGSDDDGDSLKMTPRNSLNNRPPLVSQRSNSSVNYNNSSSGRLVSPRLSSLSAADSPTAASAAGLTPTNVKKITSFDGSLACSTDSFDNFGTNAFANQSQTFKPVFGRQSSVPPRPGSGGSSSISMLNVIAESGSQQQPLQQAPPGPAAPSSSAAVTVPTLASLNARTSSPPKSARRKDSLISTISFLSLGGGAAGAGGGNGMSRFGSTDSLFRSERLKSFQSTNTLVEPQRDSPGASGAVGSVIFEASLNVTLSLEEISLLFDLTVQDTSGSCGGGLAHRRTLFESMKTGVLADALAFLQTAAVPLPADIAVPLCYSRSVNGGSPFPNRDGSEVTVNSSITAINDASNLNNSISKRNSLSSLIPSWTRKSGVSVNSTSTSSAPHGVSYSRVSNSTDTTQEVKLSPINYGSVMSRSNVGITSTTGDMLNCESDDSDLFSGHRVKAPLHCVPLTLLASRGAASLPWEILLQKERVIRAASLVSLCAQHFSRRSPFSLLNENNSKVGERPVSLTPTASAALSVAVGAGRMVPPLFPSEGAAGKPPLPSPKVLVPSLAVNRVTVELKAKGYLGPGWNQKPVFVANANFEAGDLVLPPDVMNSMEKHRRAKAAIGSVQALLHRSDPLVTNHKSLFNVPQLSQYYLKNDRSNNNYLFPITSPLISTGHTSPNSLRVSNHLELTIVELHADYDRTLTQFMVNFERKLTTLKNGSNDNLLDSDFVSDGAKSSPEESPFPILFLSYSDLIEASDAMQYIAARRFDAVFIFAPHFIIEPLAVEVKIALNRWCRPAMKLSVTNLKRSKSSSLPSKGGGGLVGTLKRLSSSLNSRANPTAAAATESGVTRSVSPNHANRPLPAPPVSSGDTTTAAEGKDQQQQQRQEGRPGSKSLFSSKSMHSSFDSRNGNKRNSGSKNKGHNKSFGDQPSMLQEHSQRSFGSSSGKFSRPSFFKRSSGSTDVELDGSLHDPSPPSQTATDSPASSNSGVVANNTANNSSGNSLRTVSIDNLRINLPSQDQPKSGNGATPRVVSAPAAVAAGGGKSGNNNNAPNKSIRAKDRTWVYHALLEVVTRMQEEHAVPISIFI